MGTLEFLYETLPGRVLLKALTCRGLSRVCGHFLDSGLSRFLIPGFVKSNKIDLTQCESDKFSCFNDCFTRQLKKELRPIDMEDGALVSPCDGLLSAYPIEKNLVLPVKQSRYTVEALLQDDELASKFNEGYCLVFRLCVNHYHRYCYIDDGSKGENHFIPGKLHTVRPIALRNVPVFTENCREYTVMQTDNFGDVVQMEVGAMLVGKIKNHHGIWETHRGEEKGMFLYGGSTIILLLEKDAVNLEPAILQATAAGRETDVKMGEVIGRKPD